jgi:hypothetical protein
MSKTKPRTVYTCVDESGKVNRYSCNPEDLDGIHTDHVPEGYFKSRTGYTRRWADLAPLRVPTLSCGNVDGNRIYRCFLTPDGQRLFVLGPNGTACPIDDEALINWIQGDDL